MSEPIVCKPTSWFLLRAVAVLTMCGVFAVYFYYDGSIGYRRQNATFFLHKAFERAGHDFAAQRNQGGLDAASWKSYAAAQKVDFPSDPALLPPEAQPGMAWPEVLTDYQRMQTTQWNFLWREFSGQWPHWRMSDEPSDHAPYDAGKIREQWTVMWICLALFAVAAFTLLRTLMRRIELSGGVLRAANGKRVALADIKRLDLRKWSGKGLAFVDYDGASGKGRVRIDGLTYGGFKHEHGEPAERLVQALRGQISGEIVEYVIEDEAAAEDLRPPAGGHS